MLLSGSMVVSPFFAMAKMMIFSKHKMVICSKYINEIKLHKNFIYYNNIIFRSSNHTPGSIVH
jgi:hypothetical protein